MKRREEKEKGRHKSGSLSWTLLHYTNRQQLIVRKRVNSEPSVVGSTATDRDKKEMDGRVEDCELIKASKREADCEDRKKCAR